MTIRNILAELDPVKPITREWLYVLMRRFKIKPIGARQIPRHYPDDTPQIILSKLGLAKPANGTKRNTRNTRNTRNGAKP